MLGVALYNPLMDMFLGFVLHLVKVSVISMRFPREIENRHVRVQIVSNDHRIFLLEMSIHNRHE